MTLSGILYPVLTLGGLGVFFGALLAVSSRIFYVKQNDLLEPVVSALPGANCGGCGYSGCANLAQAIIEGKAKPNTCPVGGAKSAEAIAKILGIDAGETDRRIAHVSCRGGIQSKRKYSYDGLHDCQAANATAGGPLECTYGCIGLGSCVRACKYNALFIENGVAVVQAENCRACGQCVATCPRHLISIVSDKQDVFVSCSSHAKGAELRKICNIGCIGCMLCQKACPTGAITVTDNLASIDYTKCSNCGACANVCPRHLIVDASKSEVNVLTEE